MNSRLERESGIEVARAAGIIAFGNVASRVLGLVREMVKSGLFGAGPHVDALNAALRVPTTLYDLLVGGMINSALIPVLSDYTAPERQAELWHLLSVLISLALLVTSGLVLLGEVLAPYIVVILVGGLPPAYHHLTATLLRIVLPAVIFLSLASILSGGLYALKRFALPAFTAAIFNSGVVLVALALGRVWGVHSMAGGLVVGAFLQVVLQLPGLRGARLRPGFEVWHPALLRIGQLYLPILIGLVVDTLGVLLSYNLASRIGAGSISWMEYAATIIQFPLGLVVTAVSLAILPTLSQQASADDGDRFRATLAQGIRLVMIMIVPATVGLYVLAHPLVALVFEHDQFTTADTMATAMALRYALPGLLAAAVDQLLIVAFYARKDTLTPALVGVGATVFYAATALATWWSRALTLPLLVLINSLKLIVHAVVMWVLTYRRMGPAGDSVTWATIAKAIMASALMAWVVSKSLGFLIGLRLPGLLGELSTVVGAGGMGALIYGGTIWVWRVEELRLMWAVIARGVRRLTMSRR